MIVPSVNNAAPGAPSPASSPAPAGALGPNSFLTLLAAELRNQDPTKPMDPTQMVSQLATINSVQQAAETNSTLTSLLSVNSFLQAEQLVGKKVATAGGVSGVVTSVTMNGADSTATLSDGSIVALRDVLRVSA